MAGEQNILSEEQVTSYHRDGYLLVPGVFSESEIATFSRAGRAAPGTANTNTSVCLVPGLNDIWCDPRIVAIAKALLPSTPVFFGEANYVRYEFGDDGDMQGRHLHHDAKGTPEHIFNRLHDVLPITYPVLRFGIYLQDFREQSGGIKVSPGSHHISTSDFTDTQFQHLNVPSKPGDVVCFTMRLLHSPFGMRLKSAPERGLAPSEEDALFYRDPGAFLPSPRERETFFIDFASCHELADLQIKSRALHPGNLKRGVAASFLSDRNRAFASDRQISFRVDYGIIEIVRKVSEAIMSNSLDAEVLSYLDMLPALCRVHEEWSGHFPIYQHRVCELSRESAGNIFNLIAPQIGAYTGMLKTKQPDSHMRGSKRT